MHESCIHLRPCSGSLKSLINKQKIFIVCEATLQYPPPCAMLVIAVLIASVGIVSSFRLISFRDEITVFFFLSSGFLCPNHALFEYPINILNYVYDFCRFMAPL